MGVAALVAPALSSILRWPLPSHIAWVSWPSLHRCCCPYWAGMFAPMHWCCCPCNAGVVALGTLTLAPLSCRILCLCCAFVVQLIHRCLHPCGRPRHRQWKHQRNKGNGASTKRAATPAQWGQWCQHKGNNASTIDDASVMRTHASATRGTMRTRW